MLLGAILSCSCLAGAQQPDVQFKANLLPTVSTGLGSANQFRWYDLLGNYSTVGLSVTFEQGYHIYLTERLQKIAGNSDTEQLDEYYVEDPGIWRVGKQYLPFGHQGILREDARAARGDTRLLFPGIPLSLAVCDNGANSVRGAVGHIGSTFGVSFAFGHDFGAESTDLTYFRHPYEAPGPGRGYQGVVGADFSRRWGQYSVQAEFAALRGGETALDKSTDLSDLSGTLQPNRYYSMTLGWSRDYGAGDNFFRLQSKVLLTKNFWLEPMVRLKDSDFYDLGVTLHVRL